MAALPGRRGDDHGQHLLRNGESPGDRVGNGRPGRRVRLAELVRHHFGQHLRRGLVHLAGLDGVPRRHGPNLDRGGWERQRQLLQHRRSLQHDPAVRHQQVAGGRHRASPARDLRRAADDRPHVDAQRSERRDLGHRTARRREPRRTTRRRHRSRLRHHDLGARDHQRFPRPVQRDRRRRPDRWGPAVARGRERGDVRGQRGRQFQLRRTRSSSTTVR